ncbi:MAG TPA: hypothetical protein VF868_05530 [Bacteroidia bacterium]|jgi:hypothetical protein
MEEFIPVEPEGQPKRPVFLTVLCILTFISTGFSIIGAMIIPVMADFMIEVITQSREYDPAVYTDLFKVWKAGWGFYITVLAFTVLSLVGAIYMWNLRKNGFHFYTIANIILSYLPIVWLGLPVNIAGFFFPAAFIGMYALHLKFMK